MGWRRSGASAALFLRRPALARLTMSGASFHLKDFENALFGILFLMSDGNLRVRARASNGNEGMMADARNPLRRTQSGPYRALNDCSSTVS